MSRLEPPVGATAWSPDFVAQTLELLIAHGSGDEIRTLRPVHDGHVVLTYLAIVEPPEAPSPHLVSEPVLRTDLARGDATAPPKSIAVGQVVEHALRHLAWLIADDPVIAAALPDWRPRLRPYVPEPFRGL
jgi:hypothetical protein